MVLVRSIPFVTPKTRCLRDELFRLCVFAMSRFYLGIDGGQSSTTALIANESGQVIGYGAGGPCNHVAAAEGREKFRSAVDDCIGQACLQAGLDSATVSFASVCLGFSGGAEDKDAYSRELIQSERYKITHDAEIALSGATGGGPGIIIIAGTGSMAFGRNARGETSRAGGWGYIFGDEGGGFDLVRRALRAALAYEEGWGDPTALKGVLLKRTGAASINTLLHAFYGGSYTRTTFASFAPLLTEAAQAGDRAALNILKSAATELVRYTEGVYRTLFREQERAQVACIGGVFASTPLRRHYEELLKQGTSCIVTTPKFDPVAGALLDALRLDGNQSELCGWKSD